MVKARSLN